MKVILRDEGDSRGPIAIDRTIGISHQLPRAFAFDPHEDAVRPFEVFNGCAHPQEFGVETTAWPASNLSKH